LPTIKEFLQVALTFSLTVFAWIFFRAENMTHALSYISEIFSPSLFKTPYYPGIGLAIPTILLLMLFLLVEWIGRESQFAIENIGLKWRKPMRWLAYFCVIYLISHFGGKQQEFIYFQF
tara:strand:+ start:81 stop:437 length:357 start_codon:yes stop_codon:yes gene_type:complete